MSYSLRFVQSTSALSRHLSRHFSDTQERGKLLEHINMLKQKREQMSNLRAKVVQERTIINKELVQVTEEIENAKIALQNYIKN